MQGLEIHENRPSNTAFMYMYRLSVIFVFDRIFKRYRELAPNRVPRDMKTEKTKNLKIPAIEVEAMPELKVT